MVLACDPSRADGLAAVRKLAKHSGQPARHRRLLRSARRRRALRARRRRQRLRGRRPARATLTAATRSALAGQVSLPRELHRCAVRPAFSHREKQVLALVVRGLGNRQIALRLFLSESTVKSHLASAFQKLGVRSRKEAAAVLLDPDEGLGSTHPLRGPGPGELGVRAAVHSEAGDAREAPLAAAGGGDRAGRRRRPEPREQSLPRGRTWILIVADMVAIAAALAITYAVAEVVASPSIIAPTWLTCCWPSLVLPGLGRDLHRLQPLRAPEPQHLAGHLRRGGRALPRAASPGRCSS